MYGQGRKSPYPEYVLVRSPSPMQSRSRTTSFGGRIMPGANSYETMTIPQASRASVIDDDRMEPALVRMVPRGANIYLEEVRPEPQFIRMSRPANSASSLESNPQLMRLARGMSNMSMDDVLRADKSPVVRVLSRGGSPCSAQELPWQEPQYVRLVEQGPSRISPNKVPSSEACPECVKELFRQERKIVAPAQPQIHYISPECSRSRKNMISPTASTRVARCTRCGVCSPASPT